MIPTLVRCMMALTAELGDRIKLQLSHCNFMVGCEECWFNDDKVWSEEQLIKVSSYIVSSPKLFRLLYLLLQH